MPSASVDTGDLPCGSRPCSQAPMSLLDPLWSVDDHMDGHGEQPEPALGGSAGRSENLQEGPGGA